MVQTHVFSKKQSHYNRKTYVKNCGRILGIIGIFVEIVDLQIVKFLLILPHKDLHLFVQLINTY